MRLPKIKNAKGEVVQFRDWQKEALTESIKRAQEGGKSYFINVCPGGGKTTFGVGLSVWALNADYADRVIVLGPRDKIRQQWQDQLMINGIPTEQINRQKAIGRMNGNLAAKKCIVVTYQMARDPSVAEYLRALSNKYRIIVIADEVHWLGHHDTGSTRWGEAFMSFSDNARFVMPLSGTPFREDHYVLPFLQYEGGCSTPDYNYTYRNALGADAVTPIQFNDYNGIIRFKRRDEETDEVIEEMEMDFDDDDDGWIYKQNGEKDDVAMNMRLAASLQPGSEHWRMVMDRAIDGLNRIRNEHRNAGGIVFAMHQDHARAIAGYIAKKTGRNPAVIISDESKDIDAFADGDEPWVVSVRMISEGVDIPRLRVVAMLTNWTTRKHFMQSIARAIRVDYESGIQAPAQWAHVYMPADPRFKLWAKEYQDAVADTEREPPTASGGSGAGGQRRVYEVDDAEGNFGGARIGDEYWSAEDLADSAAEFERTVDDASVRMMRARFTDEEYQLIATQIIASERKRTETL